MRPVLWGLLGTRRLPAIGLRPADIAAAKYSAMDSFTIKLPADIQTTVADLIMRKVALWEGLGKGN